MDSPATLTDADIARLDAARPTLTDEDIQKHDAQGGDKPASSHEGGFWGGVKEAVSNAPESLLHVIKTSMQGVGPQSGTVEHSTDKPDPDATEGSSLHNFTFNVEKGLRDWWKGITDRYGDPDKALETIKKDPAGVAQDIGLLVAGGRGAIEGGPAEASGVQGAIDRTTQAADAAGSAVADAAKAGGVDIAKGTGKAAMAGGAAGAVAHVPMLGPPLSLATGYVFGKPAIKQISKGLKAGYAAGKATFAEKMAQAVEDAKAVDTSSPVDTSAVKVNVPPTAGAVPMPQPQASNFTWPGQMNGPEASAGEVRMPSNDGTPATPSQSESIALSKRSAKARALAQVLSQSGVAAGDLEAALSPAEKGAQAMQLRNAAKAQLSELVKALKLNATGQLSDDSIAETLFELKKLERVTQPVGQ